LQAQGCPEPNMVHQTASRRVKSGALAAAGEWLAVQHEVDELYHRWREAGAKILAEPED